MFGSKNPQVEYPELGNTKAKPKTNGLVVLVCLICGLIIGFVIGVSSSESASTSNSEKVEELQRQIGVLQSKLDAANATDTDGSDSGSDSNQITVDNGVWQVGTDIPAGTYKATEEVPDTCFWSITANGDIIDNDFPGGGFPQVTVSDGQQLKLSGCGVWAKQ